MARSAEAGYVIGVLSGVGSLANLTPLADILIDTIDTLQESFIIREPIEYQPPEIVEGLTGLNPDPALLGNRSDIYPSLRGGCFALSGASVRRAQSKRFRRLRSVPLASNLMLN